MILWKFTIREVKNRPGRATLTLLSIIIGVAAVVAVTVGTATTHQAYQEMYESVAGRAAFEVAGESGGFFAEDVVQRIEQVPGVKTAVPTVQKYAALWHGKSHLKMLVMGIDPTHDEAVRDYELKEGAFFRGKYEALLETGFARGLGASLGDEVKLGVSRGGLHGSTKKFKITGLLSPRGAAGFNQGGVIFLPLKTAETLFSKPGNINSISIVLAETADEKGVAAEIAKILPTGLSVRSPMARSQLTKDTVQDAEKGLNFAYALMIVLAVFTIFNTFLMNVGERRRQLAVLRAIGATRRQIMRMLLLEGLAMGFAGTVLGSLVGLAGAYGLTQAMGRVYGTTMPTLLITPGPFIVVAFLGPGISLFAMFIPARIAGKISPLEGMRFVASETRRRITLRYIILSVVAFVLSGSLLGACITGYLPIELTVYAGAVFTAAFVLLVPIVLGALAWLATTILYPFLRVEGRIAQRQILRRRVRTTLTVGLLYIAVSTAISLGTTILNCVEDIRTWQAKTFMGDFIIRSMTPDLSTGMMPPMPESLGHELRKIDGVANVDSLRFVSASLRVPSFPSGKQAVIVMVRDFTDQGNLPLALQGGDPVEIRKRLTAGQVVLGTVLANRAHISVDDEVTLDTDKGPQKFRVAGTATAYLEGGMLIYMEGQTARRLLGVEDVHTYIVNAAPGAQAQVKEKLNALCGESGLLLQSFSDLRRRIDDVMKVVVASLWGLLALGFIVGSFGIANTLTMNVLEQTRELALLRVVAMTRWQVRKTILAQAVIIGFIGLTLGVAGGIIGSYVSNLCALPLLGHAVEFVLHPSLMAVCFATGLVVTIAAAWIPAERAARLQLFIALQYE